MVVPAAGVALALTLRGSSTWIASWSSANWITAGVEARIPKVTVIRSSAVLLPLSVTRREMSRVTRPPGTSQIARSAPRSTSSCAFSPVVVWVPAPSFQDHWMIVRDGSLVDDHEPSSFTRALPEAGSMGTTGLGVQSATATGVSA